SYAASGMSPESPDRTFRHTSCCSRAQRSRLASGRSSSASGLRAHCGEQRPSAAVPDVQASVVLVEHDADLRPGFVELPEIALGNIACEVVVLPGPRSRCASAHDM